MIVHAEWDTAGGLFLDSADGSSRWRFTSELEACGVPTAICAFVSDVRVLVGELETQASTMREEGLLTQHLSLLGEMEAARQQRSELLQRFSCPSSKQPSVKPTRRLCDPAKLAASICRVGWASIDGVLEDGSASVQAARCILPECGKH